MNSPTPLRPPENLTNNVYHQPVTGDHSSSSSANVGVGLFLALAAFGVSIVAAVLAVCLVIFVPQLIDAKVEKAIAQQSEKLAVPIAQAQADARDAKKHSDVAVNDAQRLRAELVAQGKVKGETH